jgi:hypothetical protein
MTLAPRRPERFNAQFGVSRASINAQQNPNPWARGQYNGTQAPTSLDPRDGGLRLAATGIVSEEIAGAFLDKLGVNMTHGGSRIGIPMTTDLTMACIHRDKDTQILKILK